MNISLIENLLSKPIAFHRIFATVAGGTAEGVFLSQAYYWSFRSTIEGGWFYKSRDEWAEETALTRREQESARKKLMTMGILEEKREGLPYKLFYRVNREKLYQIIEKSASNPCGCQLVRNDQQDGNKCPTVRLEMTNKTVTNAQPSIYTEITSEITSEREEPSQHNQSRFEVGGDERPQTPTLLTNKPETLTQTDKPASRSLVPPQFDNPEQSKYNASARCDRAFQQKELPLWRINEKEFDPDFVESWRKHLSGSGEWKSSGREPMTGDAIRSLGRMERNNPEDVELAYGAYLERKVKQEKDQERSLSKVVVAPSDEQGYIKPELTPEQAQKIEAMKQKYKKAV